MSGVSNGGVRVTPGPWCFHQMVRHGALILVSVIDKATMRRFGNQQVAKKWLGALWSTCEKLCENRRTNEVGKFIENKNPGSRYFRYGVIPS